MILLFASVLYLSDISIIDFDVTFIGENQLFMFDGFIFILTYDIDNFLSVYLRRV